MESINQVLSILTERTNLAQMQINGLQDDLVTINSGNTSTGFPDIDTGTSGQILMLDNSSPPQAVWATSSGVPAPPTPATDVTDFRLVSNNSTGTATRWEEVDTSFSSITTSTINSIDGDFTNGIIPLKIYQSSLSSNSADRNVGIHKDLNIGRLIFGHGVFLYGDTAHNGPPGMSLRDGRAGNIYFTGYVSPNSYLSSRYYPQVWNGPSYDRLKHNEIIIKNGLDIIRQLIPQKYQKTNEMKDANFNGELEEGSWKWEAGVIAQDVEKVKGLEYLVGPGGFPSEEDVKNGVVYKEYPKTVVYNDLFVYNIAATKELDTIVNDLSNNLSISNNKIVNLEAENVILKNENNDLKNQLNVIKSALNELLSAAGKNTI